jgi:hypothetical protein
VGPETAISAIDSVFDFSFGRVSVKPYFVVSTAVKPWIMITVPEEVIPPVTTKKYDRWRSGVLAIFCQLLILQTALGQPAVQQGLRIIVIEGEGARNVTQQISARPLIVRIVDPSGRAVSGANVTFTAPQVGASGDFENDSRTIRVVSGGDGNANAGSFHPNGMEGPYQIVVRAEFQGQMATQSILQRNVSKGGGHKKVILILAIAGAAAGAAVAAHTNNGSSSSAPTITFGGSAVGAPK